MVGWPGQMILIDWNGEGFWGGELLKRGGGDRVQLDGGAGGKPAEANIGVDAKQFRFVRGM